MGRMAKKVMRKNEVKDRKRLEKLVDRKERIRRKQG